MGSNEEFPQPFLPVGKPGTSVGENSNHNLGVLPGDVVRWQKTLDTIGDPCPEKHHGTSHMTPTTMEPIHPSGLCPGAEQENFLVTLRE